MTSTADRLPVDAADLWARFLASPVASADAAARLYGTMRVGDTAASADQGARLIREGVKTATSSLAAEYAGETRPPRAGDLTIVLDGGDRAVCIVETTEARHRPFSEVDADFARDYGEWDGTLATWQRECGGYCAALCRDLGAAWSAETILVCERFRVVFPAP